MEKRRQKQISSLAIAFLRTSLRNAKRQHRTRSQEIICSQSSETVLQFLFPSLLTKAGLGQANYRNVCQVSLMWSSEFCL